MDGENVPFVPKDGNKQLFNSPRLSDVRFLVDGQTVYGHKMVLAIGSPVFESMFYGELKEQREIIEIKDLTPLGFKNVLRYIYGFEVDFKLSELYESYVAADKYLVNEFSKDFFKYIKGKLNAENSCLIYDQLMKTGEREEISLADVRTVVIESSKEAFESECFTQIDQDTVISLLSLDELSIDDKANRLVIELKTSRNAEASACSVFMKKSGSVEYSYSRTMYVSANQSIKIEALHTVYSESAAKLNLTIRDSKGVDSGPNPDAILKDGQWSFLFKPPLVFEPGCLYTLQITGDEQLTKKHLLMRNPTFGSQKYSIVCDVGPNSEDPDYSGRHFLKGIRFIPPKSD